jgi:hypothetical protein
MKCLAFTFALLLSASGVFARAMVVECRAHLEISNLYARTITEKKVLLEITVDDSVQRVEKFTSYLLPACTDPEVKTEACHCKVDSDRIECVGQGVFLDALNSRKTEGKFTIDRLSGKIYGKVKNHLSNGYDEFFIDGKCSLPRQSNY